MTEKNVFEPSVEAIRGVIAEEMDWNPGVLRLERSVTGRYNTTWFASGGPRDLVVRVAPADDRSRMLFYEHRMIRQEPGLHRLLREKTDIPVAEILVHRESDSRIGRDFLIMERLPGRPVLYMAGKRNRVLADVGRCLRQAHDLTADQYGYLGEHRPMEPAGDWKSAFFTMWHLLLDDLSGCGGYTVEEADEFRRLLDRHETSFERPVQASLLHMDVWDENILVDGSGSLTGLVDWDRALWGDPEIEFAVLDYCGISEPAFWEGYGRRREVSREAEIRRVFYLLYEVQKYIVIQRARHDNPRQADGYKVTAARMAEPLKTLPGQFDRA